MRWLMDELKEFWNSFEWLCILVFSWMIPLGFLDSNSYNDLTDPPYGYFRSLAFWAVPILFLLPNYLRKTVSDHRSRWAFGGTVLAILVLGSVLDCFFGHYVFKFAGPPESENLYLGLYAPGVDMPIPVEEFLFYFLGSMCILLVYDWATRKLVDLSTGRKPAASRESLFGFSKSALGWAVILIAAGIPLKGFYSGNWGLPTYYTFLIVVGFAPVILLYKPVKNDVNWVAFALTSLYTIGTSGIYEVGLAVPHHWWGYKASGMIGKFLDSGTHLHHGALDPDFDWPLPIEVMMVWVIIPFSCVLVFESLKFVLAQSHRSSTGRLPRRQNAGTGTKFRPLLRASRNVRG